MAQKRKYNAKNNKVARARFARWSRNPASDIARQAKMATSIKTYDPNVNDWKGVDTPGSRMPANTWASRKPRRKRTRSKSTKRGPKKTIGKRKRSSKRASSGKRNNSAWIAHVRATRAGTGMTYKQALKAASATYQRKAPPAVSSSSSGFSSRAAWLAHLKASKSRKEASRTWMKKGADPFTNFMAAGGNQDQMAFTEEMMPGSSSVYWGSSGTVPLNPPA